MTVPQRKKAEDIAPGNWEEILKSAGMGEFLQYKEGPCPLCGGTTRFRWRSAEKKHGETGYCRYCGLVPPFEMLKKALGKEFAGAADFVRRWGGYGDGNAEDQTPRVLRVAKPAPVVVEDLSGLRTWYQTIWNQSHPIIEGDPAWKYLHGRLKGLKVIPKTLRLHPSLPYYTEDPSDEKKKILVGYYPCMIAAVQGLDGKAVNIWRTYLTEEGTKADVEVVKKASGKFLQPSYAIRLAEPGEELAIAEGIETALAVTIMTGLPCWATCSSGGMKKFDVPEGYERVRKYRIFADNDAPDRFGRRAGNDAAKDLQDRLRAKGLIATVALPKFTNFDFGDIVKQVA